MHLWPGNSGEFNFSVFKAPLKSPALPDLIFGKVPAQRPGTPGEQLRVVLIMREGLDFLYIDTDTFANQIRTIKITKY